MQLSRQSLFLLLSAAMLHAAAIQATEAPDLDPLARQYLVLELAMGRHDPAHVDAYFGPAELQEAAETNAWGLEEILTRTEALNRRLAEFKLESDNYLHVLRTKGLQERLQALVTRAQMAQGTKFPFDEESRLLFGAVAPRHDAGHFQAVLDQVEEMLPGEGSLEARVNAFREQFVVPPDRLAAVFEAAIDECRRRTAEHIELPESESFRVEYVSDKPWSGYNWYQGDYQSLIQVNTDLPTYIDRAVDLGCHEGYPGHHVYNLLLEKSLVKERGWVENSLYPLFSPQSLIAEGSANYGISMAFSPEERITFEKEVLFPLAGLDADSADAYYELLQLTKKLNYAGNESARAYLDGDMSAEQAIAWLMQYALATRERAEQRNRFVDTYRSYVINYNLGQDLVRDWVAQGEADEALRWHRFRQLLSSPMSAADLRIE